LAVRVPWKLALVAAGVLPYVVAQSWVDLQLRAWHPITVPIRLRAGEFASLEFTTNATAGYDILLEVDRKIAFDRTVCLLGLAYGDEARRCPGIPEVLDLRWTVRSQGRVIASEPIEAVRQGTYSDTIARRIGRFDAVEGQRYAVEVSVLRDGSELDPTNPRLIVEIPGYWEGPSMLLQLTFLLAVVVVGCALIFALPGAFRALRRWHTAPGA